MEHNTRYSSVDNPGESQDMIQTERGQICQTLFDTGNMNETRNDNIVGIKTGMKTTGNVCTNGERD